MKARSLTAFIGALVLVTGASTSAQTRNGGGPAKSWTPKHLADGQPDIQGMWPIINLISTPFQRDPKYGDSAVMPIEDAKKLEGEFSFTVQ